MTIPSHPVFEVLAFVVGYRYYLYLKAKKNPTPLSPAAEWWIIVGMAAGAFIGSRFIAALEDPALFIHPTAWFYYVAEQTIAGGIAGGIIGVEIVKKMLRIKRKTGDVFTYPLILGIMIGRVGCFLTGVSDGTVGLPSNLPWAFDQGDGIPRHPTSLYEIAFLGILWMVLRRIEKRKILPEGGLFMAFVLGYSLFRLFEEFLKPRDALWIGLSSIQLLSLCLVIYCCVYFARAWPRHAHDHSRSRLVHTE